MEGAAVFGVSGPLELANDLLTRGPAGTVKLVPVAAPSHPLALMEGPVLAAAARDQLQLVLTDRSALTQGRDFGVLSVRSWRLADLGAKHALLLAGMGWGNMPKPMVNEDLKRGRLVELKIEMPGEPVYPFHTVYRNDAPPGPAAAWLMERLASA
jgi:DNA-binding transcriptional LysR family regulator